MASFFSRKYYFPNKKKYTYNEKLSTSEACPNYTEKELKFIIYKVKRAKIQTKTHKNSGKTAKKAQFRFTWNEC